MSRARRPMSHRNCRLVRYPLLLTVVPPMLFGPVPGLAGVALVLLAVIGAVWLLGARRSRAAVHGGRARIAGLLDGFAWASGFGLLLGCTFAPGPTFGPTAASAVVAAAWVGLTVVHRVVHPHRHRRY